MAVSKSLSGCKTYFTTANTFEVKFGYHRAVRKGPFIFVSGTTALNPDTGAIEHPGDAKLQARVAMNRCADAVKQLGGRAEDVMRCRMFVARHEDTSGVGEAFKEVFGRDLDTEVGCAATMIVVKDGFVDKEMLVEVEVDSLLEV